MGPRKLAAVFIAATALSLVPAGARAATPGWAQTAVTYVKSHNYIADIDANRAMSRRAFSRMMQRAFGGGFSKTKGKVKAKEVAAALVKALGRGSLADRISGLRSPDGWDPGISRTDGFEIVAREMGLRHDRPTTEEAREASAGEPLLQADIAYAVWRAKTGASYWGADELAGFQLDNYSKVTKEVVRFAFNQVGQPYVWSGEWATRSPAGYPYGAQAHGGFDCSGFTWYVLRHSAPGWNPPKRPYAGWSLGERSSSDMAARTSNKLSYRELRPGDVMLFAPGGRKAGAAAVYHAGIYLGRGWMIDSSGGQAGVSLSRVGGDAWWNAQFAWGRRVIR